MNKKKIIFLSIIGALTITGVVLVIRRRRKGLDSFGKSGGFFKDKNKGNTGLNAGENPNLIDGDLAFNPQPYAERIYNALSGFGTNEDEFFAVYDELNDQERIQVNNFFDEADVGRGTTLRDWVEGDFCNWWDNKENCNKTE